MGTLGRMVFLYGIFFGLGTLACQACGDTSKNCYEDCNKDGDCGPGMVCGQNGCLPDDCKDCWDNGRTCSTTANGDTCDFSSCD